jgi:hypothetical protein
MIDCQIFIVFHKSIEDECYVNISDDILNKYFTFIAVNENIPKKYTKNKYKVINEWELPIYDSKLQSVGFNENSAIYHIYINNIHKKYKYIGFFQYDMIFGNDINTLFNLELQNNTCYTVGKAFTYDECIYHLSNEDNTINFILNDYKVFNNKEMNIKLLYPLCNTFIIESNKFDNIMIYVSRLYYKLYPWCNEPPNRSHFGHIAGIFERIMGLCIGNICENYIILDAEHSGRIKCNVNNL